MLPQYTICSTMLLFLFYLAVNWFCHFINYVVKSSYVYDQWDFDIDIQIHKNARTYDEQIVDEFRVKCNFNIFFSGKLTVKSELKEDL